MNPFKVFPDKQITEAGPISKTFLGIGIRRFLDACRYVHAQPYGYNSDRDDLMILFKEKMGTCTTKHAVIASLAAELGQNFGRIQPALCADDPLFPGIWKSPG